MVNSRKKIAISVVLVLLGLGLLVYGVAFHVINIHPNDDNAAAVETPEPEAVRQASVGGLERDDSGKIKQNHSGQSPEACAT